MKSQVKELLVFIQLLDDVAIDIRGNFSRNPPGETQVQQCESYFFANHKF